MIPGRSRKPQLGAITSLGLLATLVITGCEPALPGRDAEGAREFNSRTLVVGDNAVQLHAGLAVHIFEVDALADQDVEIIATPTKRAKLGIGFIESPDGREFNAYPGAILASADGRFRIKPKSAGEDGTGFRFLGTATNAGTWRFSILAQPRLTRERAYDLLGDIDWHHNLPAYVVFTLYMLADQPTISRELAEYFYWSFSDILLLDESVDITIHVSTAQAGALIDPNDITDGSGTDGGGTDGGGTDGGGTDGGGTDGGGTDGGGTDGGGTDGGNTDPPQVTVFQAIIRTGDDVPEQDGATFTYFGNPVIDNDGRVAFYAAYEGGDGNAGLYVWEDQQLTRVFDTGSDWAGSIPGLGAEDYFGDITIRWNQGSPHLAWGSDGRLLFATSINGFSQPNALFRWQASEGDLLLVGNAELMTTAIADAGAPEDFLPEFYHPGLADDGTAFFSSRYTYFRADGSFALFQRGIFSTDGETTVAIGTGDVPEQQYGVFQDKPVLITSHNAAGELLFQAEYTLGNGNEGVYLLADGELYRVIDNGTSRVFDGLPLGAQVNSARENYQAIAVGEQGHIAIDTTLTVDSATRDTVLLWNNTRWYELQSTNGEYATDLLTGVSDDGRVVYLANERPYLGDGQTTVDLAESMPDQLVDVNLQWEPYGAAINNHGRALVRYTRPDDDDAPGILLWSGVKWFVILDGTSPFVLDTIDAIFADQQYEPDDLDRVGTISDRPEVNRPGLSGMLNDNDQWTLRAGSLGSDGARNTADDQQAIFLGRGQ